MRYFIELAYNGAPFHGWQVQPEQYTVQGTLETAMSHLLKQQISVVGCGRTDTGVHARQFFAHFEINEQMNKSDLQNLIFHLNSFLPKEIVIFNIYPVDVETHARYSAISRTYKYYVSLIKNPFNQEYSYRFYHHLDIDKMNEAASKLLITEDFTSFSKLHTQVNNNRCRVQVANWEVVEQQLVFTITADRFLRNMVRAIVGTLLQVGCGRISLMEFQEIIDKKDRCSAGDSVPAHALFLHQVQYGDSMIDH